MVPKIFIPDCEKIWPGILNMDNLDSHYSLELLETAGQNQVSYLQLIFTQVILFHISELNNLFTFA